MKPLLFLDVDGVINVSPATPECQYVGDFELYKINLPHGLKGRIATLTENFEIVWATTWMEKAHPFYASHLGLPDEPWPCIAQFRDGIKLPEICEYAGERPFAWVDDTAHLQIRDLPNPEAWEQEPGIIIAPSWVGGLNDEHVDALLTWAAGLE